MYELVLVAVHMENFQCIASTKDSLRYQRELNAGWLGVSI